MAYYMTFSALNEKLRPRINTSDRLYSTFNRMEERQVGSLRSYPVSYRPTILTDTKGSGNTAEPEVKREPENHVHQQAEDLVSDHQEEERPPFGAPVQLTELSLSDGEEQLVDEEGSLSLAEEKDVPRELCSSAAGGPAQSTAGKDGIPLRRSYDDGTLPDLIRSGRPLGRRRTLGHVSETVGQHGLSVGLKKEGAVCVIFFFKSVEPQTGSSNSKTCHTRSKPSSQSFRSHCLLTALLHTAGTSKLLLMERS